MVINDCGKIGRVHFNIQYDKPNVHIAELMRVAKTWKYKYDIGISFVDYLQLLDNPGGDNKNERVCALSKDLNGLARTLKVPVVALALSMAIALAPV